MPINKKGGNKTKKQKNSSVESDDRVLELRDVDQEYAKVTEILGNQRYRVTCYDNKENKDKNIRLAHSRGNLKKKRVFVKKDDIVLVSLRLFENKKCDIIHVYNKKEVKRLIELGEIPLESKSLEELESNIDFEYEEENKNIEPDNKENEEIDFDLI